MNRKLFKIGRAFIATMFVMIFCVLVIPPLVQNPDIIGAFAKGFVNPYASGYSVDVICCWVVLLLWVVYEYPKVRYGWICLPLGLVPGVAFGFALYLILRSNQLKAETMS